MRILIFLGVFGLAASSWGQDYRESYKKFSEYRKAIMELQRLEKIGEKEAAQDVVCKALDKAVAADGSLEEGFFLKNREHIVFDSLNLRGKMEMSGRLALAMYEQERSERMINAWARSVGADADYDCLLDAPLPRMGDSLSGLVWRMRSARASVLSAQGDSLAALELLERTVEESKRIKVKGWMMGGELRRTYNSLGSLLSFLGYWDRAVEVFDVAIADERFKEHERVPRSVALARLNRLFPLAKMRCYTPEIVAEAKSILEESRKHLDENGVAGFQRQIAKFEYRAGLEEDARARVSELLDEKGKLSRVERMELERIYFVEDDARSDATATDADYEEMLEAYRSRGMLRSLPTLYRTYADFLDRKDRTREAIPMQLQAIHLTEGNGWELHLPMLLARLAMMYDKLGQHGDATDCWQKIDKMTEKLVASDRGLPEARRMMVAFEKLNWLERNSRVAEAKKYLAGLRKSAKRDQLGELTVKILDSVEIAEVEPSAPPAPVATKARDVVIAPVATRSVVEKGDVPARTRFSLLNPGNVPAKGILRVSGVPLGLVRRPDASVELELGVGEKNTASLPISLAAGERVIIEASAPAKDLRGKIEWLSEDKVVSAAEWLVTSETGRDGAKLAVEATTASSGTRSRFYAVPLFQEIRWTREADGETKNFRVRTSTESWVSYRTTDGKVIAVDGNGDGDFKDSGDSIASGYDRDWDLFPDAVASGELGVFALEVLVYPRGDQKEATKVEFELQNADGDWRVAASNTLRASKVGK